MAIIDELGRGTSTRDGLAIALSIAEALVDSQAIVFFATHFRELGQFQHWRFFLMLTSSSAQILDHREGVVNMHLTVEMRENSVSMLYKLGKGFVQEEHYGLALARVMNLPPKVLGVAENVSKALESQIEAKKKSSKSFALVQRQKLLLTLKAQLEELAKGPMAEKPLRAYLKKLQMEFVARLEAIDAATAEGDDSEEQDDSVTGESGAREGDSVTDNGSESEDVQSSMLI